MVIVLVQILLSKEQNSSLNIRKINEAAELQSCTCFFGSEPEFCSNAEDGREDDVDDGVIDYEEVLSEKEVPEPPLTCQTNEKPLGNVVFIFLTAGMILLPPIGLLSASSWPCPPGPRPG